MSMPEYATDSDGGCRYEVCDNGRTSDGWCRGPDYVEVENPDDDPPGDPVEPSTDPNDHPCDRQVDSADGLLGICTADGVRYCVYHEWLVCPGGGGEPCPAVSGPLAFSGRGGINTVKNTVPLTAGRWRADICLWDSPYSGSAFYVVMGEETGFQPIQIDGQWVISLLAINGPNNGGPGVDAGRWSVEFTNPVAVAHYTKFLLMTAVGGGEWTVVYTRLGDIVDTN